MKDKDAEFFHVESAPAHLRAADERMAALIDRVGELDLAPRPAASAVSVLARNIIYQQLSGKAAATIHGRFVDACGGENEVTAQRLATMHDDELRGAGISRGKLAALRSLCEYASEGMLPELDALRQMNIDELKAALTPIRGIGPWTVEMLAIFWLGHPDILPVTDLGIRKGMQILDGLPELPSAAQMTARAEPWQPYRSVASRYLWKAVDIVF